MVLVSCPECEKQVSDQAASCPNCGHPIRLEKPASQAPVKEPMSGCSLFFIIVAAIVFAALVIMVGL